MAGEARAGELGPTAWAVAAAKISWEGAAGAPAVRVGTEVPRAATVVLAARGAAVGMAAAVERLEVEVVAPAPVERPW